MLTLSSIFEILSKEQKELFQNMTKGKDMKEILLEKFINWVADYVSGDTDGKRKCDFLKLIKQEPLEAKRAISNQLHGWVIIAKAETGELVEIENMSATAEAIFNKLHEVLTKQFGDIAA
jgi:hypothetical protein